MDLRNLHTFIQVAELNSFTRAAEKLGYSQPTVSFQIKQLEQELEVQLFERIGHTVSLTAAGRDILSYAQQICRMSQEMATAEAKRREASGEIRLAMADSLCTPLVAESFSTFRKAHPNISLKVTTAGTAEMFRLLDHNEVDIVCTLDSHIYDTAYVIASEEKVGVHVVASADHPLAAKTSVAVEELVDHPFLLTEKGMSYRRLLEEALARHAVELHPILELGSADRLCRLVQENIGLSFLPDFVTWRAAEAGRLVRLPVDGLQVDLWKQVLYHRDKWMSLPLQALIKHLSDIHVS